MNTEREISIWITFSAVTFKKYLSKNGVLCHNHSTLHRLEADGMSPATLLVTGRGNSKFVSLHPVAEGTCFLVLISLHRDRNLMFVFE